MKQLYFAIGFLFAGIASADAKLPSWVKETGARISCEGRQQLFPEKYVLYKLGPDFQSGLLAATSQLREQGVILDLPMPDGSVLPFRVWETPVMAEALAARYPQIKTYTAVAVNNTTISAKLDITPSGFHAIIHDGRNTSFIDPYTNVNTGYYLSYYKKDYQLPAESRMSCGVIDVNENELKNDRLSVTDNGLPGMHMKVNGAIKRKYRLALAATVEYCAAVGGATPTKSSVLAAMVTSMNRVNSVYEREMAVTMELVANTDDLIYITAPDPYSNGNGVAMQGENQTNIDNVIGSNNYDIGHVFSTGGGGIADLGVICDDDFKARGVTGRNNPVGDPFDLDYVAHEMGHQFGATHTFNATSGFCFNNAVTYSAYEPGGGSTLMAYAGICSGNNIQNATSAYFHAKSLDQMSSYVNFGGNVCGDKTNTGNIPPVIPAFAQTYYIPYLTPFELTAPTVVDVDHDELTYCWEQYDLGDFGASFDNTKTNGPIFRSFDPSVSSTRIFPTLERLLKNENAYLGEKLPEVDRKLTFRLTVRDVLNGIGSFNFADDAMTLQVVNTGTPFKLAAPNTKADYWQIGSNVTITWDVANTTAAPINCQNVDIYLSLDDGRTWTHTLATNTPNDGSETITVPDAQTASARVKVKGAGNVFFDISNEPFIINRWSVDVKDVKANDGISIYPVPASEAINIGLNDKIDYTAIVTNALGQQVYQGMINTAGKISVAGWAKGVYHLHLIGRDSTRISKNFVVK